MKRRVSLFILPVCIAMLAALFLVSPVFAQDEVPPEDPLEAEAEIPADLAGTDPAGTDEIPPTELAPVLEEAAETGVVLVDESGEPLALAEEGTADVMAGGDPYYKVGTVTYYFRFTGECGTTPNCFESDFPISNAINHISTTGLPSDGMIYVEAGNYTEAVEVDPLTMDPILNGLKGLIGTVVDGTPKVNLNGGIIVNDADLGFTIKGFSCSSKLAINGVKGTLKIEDVTMTNNDGIGIHIANHNGVVILNRVEADGSTKGGAYINNTAGTAGVTITNSSFNHNGSDDVNYIGGLTIATKGAISMDGVTGIGNTGGFPGLFIYQSGPISIKNSIFTNNQGQGITNVFSGFSDVEPTGNISLQNVIANNNWGYGIDLGTKGNISLTKVNANSNDYRGVYLDTCRDDGVKCLWLGTGVVTIKDSTMDHNGSWDGLLVIARGAISLTNVSASGNTSLASYPRGASLENYHSQLIAPIKVISGRFNDNSGGLFIYSKGLVTLSQVSASGNLDSSGIFIDNTKGTTAGVSISGSSSSMNKFNGNYVYGIQIATNGAVNIKYSEQNGNGYRGAEIINTTGTAGVTISNGTFNDNTDTGLYVRTNGAIALTSIKASDNDLMGSDLDNSTSLSTPGVTIKGSATAYNLLTGNILYGLRILTKGAVSITYAHVDGNDGAEIINTDGKGNVTISNATFNDNKYSNLYVRTNGAIKISNIQANSSGYYGADLANHTSVTPQGVTISNATFWDNEVTGLYVASKGNIILTNVTSLENVDGYGAQLNNSLGTGYVKITNPKSTDTSIQRGFDNNSTGLSINTNGTATLTNVNAIGNQYDGIYIYGTYQKGATLTNCRVDGNAVAVGAIAGIMIDSMGPVTISGGYSNSNSKVGLQIDNTFALDTAPKPVTIQNFTANINVDRGIYVLSRGAITLTNVTANETSGASEAAIDLDNTAQTANVTLSKVKANGNVDDGIRINSKGAVKVSSSMSSENGWYGIYINTQGTITLTNMIANENDLQGAYLSNRSSLVHAAVTITGSTNGNCFSGNTDIGILILSRGAVTLNNISADGNGYEGISIDNYHMGAGLGNVTVSNAYTRDDGMAGISIGSAGNISLKSVISMLSTGNGANLFTNNHNLAISSSIFTGNYMIGIYAQLGSTGVFTMTSTMYFGNDIENNDNPNILITH